MSSPLRNYDYKYVGNDVLLLCYFCGALVGNSVIHDEYHASRGENQ